MLTNHYSYVDDNLSIINEPTKHIVYMSDIIINKNDKGRYWCWCFIIESDIDLTQAHLNNIKFSNKCFYRTISGMVGSKGYPKISVGKSEPPSNIGKKNELNQLLRLIKKGNKELEDRKKKNGYQDFKTFDENKLVTFEEINTNFNLLPICEKYKPDGKPDFPLFASIKYDGISLLMCYHGDFKDHYNNIIAYTRGRKVALGFQDLRDLMLPILKKYPGLVVVGEFYKKGIPRNKINSIHAKNVNGTLLISDMDYMIFDCFYPIPLNISIPDIDDILDEYNASIIVDNEINKEAENKLNSIIDQCNSDKSDLIYSERQDLLYSIIPKDSRIKQAVYYKFENKDELDEFHKQILKDEEEGLLIHKDCLNQFSFKKAKINPKVYKLKVYKDAEFKIIGYHLGEGHASEKIIFICECEGGQFNADVNFDEESMKELYQNIKKDKNYYNGKMAVVKYEQISDKGIPLIAKVIDVLDSDNQ